MFRPGEMCGNFSDCQLLRGYLETEFDIAVRLLGNLAYKVKLHGPLYGMAKSALQSSQNLAQSG